MMLVVDRLKLVFAIIVYTWILFMQINLMTFALMLITPGYELCINAVTFSLCIKHNVQRKSILKLRLG